MLEQTSDYQTTVTFHPTEHVLDLLHYSKEAPRPSSELMRFDSDARRLLIFPLSTRLKREDFLRPKYRVIRTLNLPLGEGDEVPQEPEQVQWFLMEKLPRGFTQDPQYGLGFPREYNPLIQAVEKQCDCTEIFFAEDGSTSIEGSRFVLTLDRYEEVRQKLELINRRSVNASLSVREIHSYNWMTQFSGKEPLPPRRSRQPMIQAFLETASGEHPTDDAAIDDLVSVVSEQSHAISRARPEALAKLRSDIELVELDSLVERFSAMLQQRSSESRWQRFFSENPFILSFTRGHPVVLVNEQASVGGRRLSGGGEKVADFLAKNPTTNNLAIIEIKRPDSKLVGREYRQGLYQPSKELTASITQALDQRYQLVQSLPLYQKNSRDPNLESYSVRVCVVIGTVPSQPDEAKSFELFRNSLRDVEVVTFDELFMSLRTLRRFMADPAPEPNT